MGSNRCPEGINLLLDMKNMDEKCDEILLNSYLQSKSKRKEISFRSTTKKKIWKPQRYIPSKNIVLANSVEELESIYKIDDRHEMIYK